MRVRGDAGMASTRTPEQQVTDMSSVLQQAVGSPAGLGLVAAADVAEWPSTTWINCAHSSSSRPYRRTQAR
jgi:hypothetical protein